MTADELKRWSKSALVLIALGLGVAWCVNNQREGRQRAALELKEARSVAVLAAGTEEAQIAYLDRRLTTAIRPVAGAVRLHGSWLGFGDTITIISTNVPYQISCGQFGITVRFGYGDDSVSVELANHNLALADEPPPPLGVHIDSIAARDLYKKLCHRVAQRLQSVMHEPTAENRK